MVSFSRSQGEPVPARSLLASLVSAAVAAEEERAAAYVAVTVGLARELQSRGGEFPVCGDYAARVRKVVDR